MQDPTSKADRDDRRRVGLASAGLVAIIGLTVDAAVRPVSVSFRLRERPEGGR